MHIKKQLWIPAVVVALVIVIFTSAGIKVEQNISGDSDMSVGGVGYAPDVKYTYGENAVRGSISYPEPSPIPDGSGLAAGEDIIKTGYLEIRVSSVEEGITNLDVIAKNYGGEILSRSVNTYQDETFGSVTLRVEQANFDRAMADIKTSASFVSSEDVSTEDVTSVVLDIEARLTNAKAEEQSYIKILDRATTVEEILMVQSYLSTARANIESYEAQLDYYSSKTSYSIINVSLSEEGAVQFESPAFRPLQAIIDAAQTVVDLLQGLVIALIYVVIVGGTVGLPIVIVAWIVTRVLRRKTGKRK